jgi:hypothetical protein
MSEAEEQQALGRLIAEYDSSRKRLAALQSRADGFAEILGRIVGVIEHDLTYPDATLDTLLSDLPSADQIRELINERAEYKSRLAKTKSLLEQCGIDLK